MDFEFFEGDFLGAGATGGTSGLRCTIFQAHMTAGIQPINEAWSAIASNPPKGLSSAKIIKQGKTMATNESNLRLVLIIYSWFLP